MASGVSGVSGASGVTSTAGASSAGGDGKLREQFATDELAIILSHFDVGVIEKIKEFPRGSRKAPKLLLKAETGNYLLKRRARGKDDPFKVAFCHELQLYLAAKQFPLPHLIGTRRDNNSMLQWRGATYELFEYIKGTPYDNSPEASHDSGKTLSLFHKLLREFTCEHEPATGSYHNSRTVTTALDATAKTLLKVGKPGAQREQQVNQLSRFLSSAYNAAAMRVEGAGIEEWPGQIVHSDWHPGNMLFRGNRVVAVIDYDAARKQQRVLDVANGALQFSILGGGEDPLQWPAHVDETRFGKFLAGVDGVPGCVMTRAELRVVPWLMIEALIAESIIPVATTGYFARMEGVPFLTMVERKVRWIQENAERLAGVLEQ
jgi:homoserine kinase type II